MGGFNYDVRSEREISRLMNVAVEVIEDLTKVWLFAYNEDVDNWIRHSRNLLRYTNKVNNKNYLNKDEIFSYTYEMNEDKIPTILEEYVEELSVILSREGYVKSSETREILIKSGLRNVPAYDMDDVVKNNWLPRKYQ